MQVKMWWLVWFSQKMIIHAPTTHVRAYKGHNHFELLECANHYDYENRCHHMIDTQCDCSLNWIKIGWLTSNFFNIIHYLHSHITDNNHNLQAFKPLTYISTRSTPFLGEHDELWYSSQVTLSYILVCGKFRPELYWWWFKIVSGNGLAPSGNMSLHESIIRRRT